MICPICGKPLPDDSMFCQYCGNEIEEFHGMTDQTGGRVSWDPDYSPDMDEAEDAVVKKRKIINLILGIVIVSLVGISSVLISSIGNLSSRYDDVQKQLDSAYASVQAQDETIKTRDVSIQLYEEVIEEYKANNDYYTEIQNWITKHGSEYKADKSYYTWSNVIAVRSGENVSLDVYYKGKRTVWCSATGDECSTKWNQKTSGNTRKLIITGVKSGVTELVFSLGNAKKADDKESFRILVIVS